MRVLHVAPSIERSYGGPTRSLAGYVASAKVTGIDVSVAAPQCGADDVESFTANAGNVKLHLFPAVGSGAFVISPALVRWVSRGCADFDVIHVHGLFNPISSLCSRAALKAGRTVVIRPFGTLSRYTFEHRRTRLKKIYLSLVERANLIGAAALHFTTTAERDAANWYGIDFSERAHVVPPAWSGRGSNGTFTENVRRGAAALFLGRIVPVKNLESLLDAWASVRREASEATLDIAGAGADTYVRALQQRAARLGVTNSVTFRGFVSGTEKQRLLSSASVLVLPSHHENFGISVIESLEAGVPVIISPDVQLADFVRRYDLGRVVPSDPPQLAAAILDVFKDANVRARAHESGPEIVARNFSLPVIGESLSKMYEAAIARTAGVAPS